MNEPTSFDIEEIKDLCKRLATKLERLEAKELSLKVYDDYCDNEWIVTVKKLCASSEVTLK